MNSRERKRGTSFCFLGNEKKETNLEIERENLEREICKQWNGALRAYI